MSHVNRKLTILTWLILLIGSSCDYGSQKNDRFIIGINQYTIHPLLDLVHQGILSGLNERSSESGQYFRILDKNANGDQTVASQINRQFVDQKVNLIIPIGTPAAQSACQITDKIPIVFAAITDPIRAGIVKSLEKPGGNRTGTSDLWPYIKQVSLIRELIPSATRVGLIFNPGESNTQASLEHIRPSLRRLGLIEIDVPVSSTSEVYAAARSLIGRVDAIFIPADNTVISAFDSVVKVANENRMPLFVGSSDCVEKGAIATYGVDYFEVGKATGLLAAKILIERKNPGDIPVVVESKADLIINLKAAELQGVKIPKNVVDGASKIIR